VSCFHVTDGGHPLWIISGKGRECHSSWIFFILSLKNEKWTWTKLIFKICVVWVALVRLTRLKKKSRHVHWRDSCAPACGLVPTWRGTLAKVDWRNSVMLTTVTRLTDMFYQTSIESRHIRRMTHEGVTRNHHGMTHWQNMAPLLSLSSSSLSFFLPSPLLTLRRLH
jgi:hypothetical protein